MIKKFDISKLIKIINKYSFINKKLVTLIYSDFSGSNTIALYKLAPKSIKTKYKIKLINKDKDSSVIKKIKNHLVLNKSRVLVTTHGLDICNEKQFSLELWHGIPLKAMGYLDKTLNDGEKRKVHNWMENTDAFCSSSKLYTDLMVKCGGISPGKFVNLGFPRNDLLFNPKLRSLERIIGQSTFNKRIVFFLPTFRSGYSTRIEGNKNWSNLFGFCEFDSERFSYFLKSNNILLITKFHPFEEKVVINKIGKIDEICIITSDSLRNNFIDLYEVLGLADLLITDYSSVYFDFLLLNKPLVFVPIDLEEYKATRGFLLEPYEEWTPGPKVFSQEEFENELVKSLNTPNYYSKERARIKNIIHTNQDDEASLRVWNYIDEVMVKTKGDN